MDRFIKEVLGGNDEPEAAPVSALSGPRTAPVDSDKEDRREARLRRKADPDRRRKREEFVDRYTTGDPREGFTSEEAIEHLRELGDEMSPEEFRAATQQTIEHLQGALPAASTSAGASADLLGGLVTRLVGAAGSAGGVGIDDALNDLTKSGQLDSPMAKAVLGGIAAFGTTLRQQATTAPSQPTAIEVTSQPTMIALPQSVLATALAHERATFADYQEITAAGDTLAEWEAKDRWEAAQQLVQQIQSR